MAETTKHTNDTKYIFTTEDIEKMKIADVEEEDMSFLPILMAAMIAVESAGDVAAIGDGGRALGCLQIHKEVIADVNRIHRTHFKHADALNPELAKEICELYLRAWAPEGASAEVCARIWNGGPRGHQKAATAAYWEKVRKHLEDQITSNIQL